MTSSLDVKLYMEDMGGSGKEQQPLSKIPTSQLGPPQRLRQHLQYLITSTPAQWTPTFLSLRGKPWLQLVSCISSPRCSAIFEF